MVSRSGWILERDERILFVCRVLEGHAQAPLKRGRGFEVIGANVLRLFTYIGGLISETPSVRTHISNDIITTTLGIPNRHGFPLY